jgi:hypothetical protein
VEDAGRVVQQLWSWLQEDSLWMLPVMLILFYLSDVIEDYYRRKRKPRR